MFYSQLLLSKKGPLGTIWIAAHCHKRLKKEQVQQTNITASVGKILLDEAPVVTYRILGHLLLGVVRIYSKKVEYLFQDCNHVLVKLADFSTGKRPTSKLSVVRIEGMRAPAHLITRPKKFALDAFDLEVSEDQDANRGHVASREDIMLSDARENEQTVFGLSSKYKKDASHSESLTTHHTPVRDIRSPHQLEKDFDVRPSLGSDHMTALWNLNETRFSLEERFEPITFGDVEIQMTSDKTADGQTDDEQMKDSNAGNSVNEEHLFEERPSMEEHAEPMIITDAETEINIDLQSEKTHQPIELIKDPDAGLNVDDEEPAGLGESFLVENRCGFDQKKNVEASSSRKGKDRPKDDRSVSLCVDVDPETKFSASTSPDCIYVRTPARKERTGVSRKRKCPARKERTQISRKRKCIFDESIVIPNEVFKHWICDASDLVCKRKKAPHSNYFAWKVHNISSLPQSFKEPIIPCSSLIDITSATCKIRSTRHGPAETVEVPPCKDLFESPNKQRPGEQVPIAHATSLHEDIPVAPATSLRECKPGSPNTLRYDGEQTPIAPATPVTGSSSLRFHDMQGTSRSHRELASSTESKEKGAVPMDDLAFEVNLIDEEINSFEGDTSEKCKFSLRTRKVVKFLLDNFLSRKGKEEVEVVNLSWLLKGKTKRDSARVFYEILVLKSGGWIDVRQDDAYSDILLQELPRLNQIFEADVFGSKS
ncbi:unnamed protein product [Withania somnifera]